MYNPISLVGKKYIITGASSGIGRATSILLSKLGATLILIDLNEIGLHETAEICENSTKILALDLLDSNELKTKILNAVSEVGKVNGFVHLAGRPYLSPLKSLNDKVLLDVLKLNSIAGLELAKICSNKSVFSGESGSFIFISSVYGCVGSAANVGYAMSKSALHGITKSLAIELAPKNIRVNCVAPGFVKTNMLDSISGSFNSEYDELINKLHPLGLGNAEDVANAIAFLVSDMAKWITGSIINVDGGFTAQ
ncbi:SDR family NAD(P)-dependent oxidoreductase [Flavobacterium sp. 2]|uniref:SDR family NAD(P)-dependent oxidoreductase n=1 Tax=Flavobacterium sp. 2 TaxID=308053 RepID=UPI000C190183|nr:SDR family oxidoreductase [Flavobacterium sp. 2]PIF59326.1 NAD(P)-dependent dehydrogenase (short-subunit alcohol dehydrogenase family) [Flavobacterium sp. 2]